MYCEHILTLAQELLGAARKARERVRENKGGRSCEAECIKEAAMIDALYPHEKHTHTILICTWNFKVLCLYIYAFGCVHQCIYLFTRINTAMVK